LSYTIQNEFKVLKFRSIVEAYQATLRVEEKLIRKQWIYKEKIGTGVGRGQPREKVEEGEVGSNTINQ
jgi:hypothetical protein